MQSLSRASVNAAGQVVSHDDYFDLTGLTYSTSTTLGTENTHYYRTHYGYDARGRQSRVQSPTGTIYRTVSDGLSRAVSTWVGTDDTPTSGLWSPTNTAGTDLVKVSENEYDVGDVGDSNLTRLTQYPGGGAADRVSAFWYDWRNRLVAVKQGVETTESSDTNRPLVYLDYDNLDQVIKVRQYDGDGVSLSTTNGVPQPPSASLLRAQSTTSYDDRGQVYRSEQFSVDSSSGTVSTTSLATNVWYDRRGNVLKLSVPGGLVSKSKYDGAGRETIAYVTDGGGDTSWSDAGSVSGDVVLEQTEYSYDANSNPLLVTTRQRFHDETATGALGDATTAPKARVSYGAFYYDAAGRLTAAVDVGTNGGSAWSRPSSVPSRSDTVLVSEYGYDAAGRLQSVTDPRGVVGRTEYDALGRVTKAIEAYTNGTPTDSSNKTTQFSYDGGGNLKTLTVVLPSSAVQTTEYVYGVSASTGSAVASNDLLRAIKHPDPSTGAASASEQETFTVNALGEVVTATDRNGTVHTFGFDVVGRPVSDAVTTLGSGVDGAVRRLETAYDTQGNAALFTSYDAASGGSVVNQVQREFNGLGQLLTEYQSHSGSVNTSTTPKVQYAYSEMAGGANHSRPTSMTYPGGKVVSANYATGLDDRISRLSSLSDSSGTLESYQYLGLGTVVVRSHPQPGLDLSYVKQSGEPNGDAGDPYTGLDRFGRVVDQRWLKAGTAVERVQYGYDRIGQRLWRDNLVSSARGELYAYDDLGQLTSFQRGTLNGAKTGLTGSASRSQSWDYDAVGNWQSVTTDGSTQTRGHNRQNELTSVSGATTPTYDADGNLTRDETGKQYVYDGWNRLVTVKDSGGNTLASYGVDALGRRVAETASGTTRDLYYSADWQVLEERVGGAVQAVNVWSPVYVDALVLRQRDTDGNGSLDERLWAVQDGNWNVTALVNDSGAVVERYGYDPFGAVSVLAADWSSRSASLYGWVYLHQGLRYDGTSGLYDARLRPLSATLGRWLQTDPLGFGAGDVNLYRAVGNAPAHTVDPFGMDPPFEEHSLQPIPLVVGGVSGGRRERTWHEWWLGSVDWAADGVAWGYDRATGGWSTYVLNSKPFGSTLEAVDGVFAGWSNKLLGGQGVHLRNALWGQAAWQNHEGTAFNVGEWIGFGHSIAMLAAGAYQLAGSLAAGAGGSGGALALVGGGEMGGGAVLTVDGAGALGVGWGWMVWMSGLPEGGGEEQRSPVTFGKNFDKKARKHIDQVRNRGPVKEDIPSPGKGGIERLQQIIRDRVGKGGGRATTYAGEPAIAFEDGGVTYIIRPNGEFWTSLGN